MNGNSWLRNDAGRRGLLHTSIRIEPGLELTDTAAQSFVDNALAKWSSVDGGLNGLDAVTDSIEQFWSVLRGHFNKIANFMPAGSSGFPLLSNSAIDRLDEIKVSIDEKIEIARLEVKRRAKTSARESVGDNVVAVSEAKLQAWWKGLPDDTKDLSQVALLQIAKEAFPKNQVSRDRIRAFTKGRKRGPRPFGGKLPAE